jgi:protein tyrosine phosphatase (PTP) superfamily phosphohydrolase (DUF442 family)
LKNVRKFDNRITIGGVPDSDDLFLLKDLGYKTLIDLRAEAEMFGGYGHEVRVGYKTLVDLRAEDEKFESVGKRVKALGMKYVSIPMSRDSLSMKDVVQFFDAIHEKGSEPIYAFSEFARKPLAFLLLFEGVAKGEKHLISMIYNKASKFGFDLEGNMYLHEFLLRVLDSGELQSTVEDIRKRRPDLYLD